MGRGAGIFDFSKFDRIQGFYAVLVSLRRGCGDSGRADFQSAADSVSRPAFRSVTGNRPYPHPVYLERRYSHAVRDLRFDSDPDIGLTGIRFVRVGFESYCLAEHRAIANSLSRNRNAEVADSRSVT